MLALPACGFSASNLAALNPAGITDPNFANVVFLAFFENVDGFASAFTELSPASHVGTFVGNAQIDTAQFKFGSSSLLLDGTGDYVSSADSADWSLGQLFTIECHGRFNSVPTGTGNGDKFASQWQGSQLAWAFGRPDGSASELNFILSTDGTTVASTITTSGAGISTVTWYHFAVDRDSSNKVRIYVDGVMKGSGTASGTIFSSTSNLAIGAEGDGARSLDGWIDNIRITKGVARYASDSGFTPPTVPYPIV